jgi:hypothetical protein
MAGKLENMTYDELVAHRLELMEFRRQNKMNMQAVTKLIDAKLGEEAQKKELERLNEKYKAQGLSPVGIESEEAVGNG